MRTRTCMQAGRQDAFSLPINPAAPRASTTHARHQRLERQRHDFSIFRRRDRSGKVHYPALFRDGRARRSREGRASRNSTFPPAEKSYPQILMRRKKRARARSPSKRVSSRKRDVIIGRIVILASEEKETREKERKGRLMPFHDSQIKGGATSRLLLSPGHGATSGDHPAKLIFRSTPYRAQLQKVECEKRRIRAPCNREDLRDRAEPDG